MIYLYLWIGLVAGNVLYAWMQADMAQGLEHCYFQGIAVLLCYILTK